MWRKSRCLNTFHCTYDNHVSLLLSLCSYNLYTYHHVSLLLSLCSYNLYTYHHVSLCSYNLYTYHHVSLCSYNLYTYHHVSPLSPSYNLYTYYHVSPLSLVTTCIHITMSLLSLPSYNLYTYHHVSPLSLPSYNLYTYHHVSRLSLPSYNLYTYDKMVAPNVSLRDQPEVSSEVLGVLLKHHYSRRLAHGHQDTAMGQYHTHTHLHASPPAPPVANDAKSQQRVVSTADRDRQQPVSMETIPSNKSSSAVAMTTSVAALGSKDVLSSVCEDDKERIVVEIVQMYSRQQEKLHSTLHNQLQLEMELEALRGGEAVRLQQLAAEQCELQSELEAVHTEHAHRLGQVREEQRELEHRLEQLRQQSCVCDNTHQEERYANQLAELRGRLDCAEADRDKLQEELRSERDAREKLERIISQLQQQMGQTASTSASFVTTGSPSPPPTPSSHTPHTEGHTAGPAEQQNGHAHK
ncbi:unnamed protein product [Oncorhynchus mykiss]|uniref:Uncharacterized protein n=1 Tax=Oncorhynchus mykiss TaxID=8022 RepID=A0A060YHE1_ONCMY|nr:unnamed protein product [Oncorhynchus mykiss]